MMNEIRPPVFHNFCFNTVHWSTWVDLDSHSLLVAIITFNSSVLYNYFWFWERNFETFMSCVRALAKATVRCYHSYTLGWVHILPHSSTYNKVRMGSTIMYLCADNITCTNKILAEINTHTVGKACLHLQVGCNHNIGKPVEPHTIFRVPFLCVFIFIQKTFIWIHNMSKHVEPTQCAAYCLLGRQVVQSHMDSSPHNVQLIFC